MTFPTLPPILPIIRVKSLYNVFQPLAPSLLFFFLIATTLLLPQLYFPLAHLLYQHLSQLYHHPRINSIALSLIFTWTSIPYQPPFVPSSITHGQKRHHGSR